MNSLNVSAKPKQIMAVGELTSGSLHLRSFAFHNHHEVVEHTINRWTADKYVAEVRVNGVMTHHSTFTGPNAKTDAQRWCELIAPMSLDNIVHNISRKHSAPIDYEAELQELRDGIEDDAFNANHCFNGR